MSSYDALVIGAGIAGIMATRTLHAAGARVLALEARTRIGGRTHSDRSLGVAVDLGGAWLHGPHGNPLTPLLRRWGITTAPTDFANQSRRAVQAYAADGAPLDMQQFSDGMHLAHGRFEYMAASLIAPLPAAGCQSSGELLATYPPSDLTPTQRAGYDYFAIMRGQFSDAADLDAIDWRLGANYVHLPGGDELVVGGYNALTDRLAAGLPIRTGAPVQRITWSRDGVAVLTADATLTAQRAIITLPLGVLKAGTVAFDPPLPAAKQGAIDRIGFGNYEKLALRFAHSFWPPQRERFNYLTDAEPPLLTEWLNIGHYTGEPILVATHSGSRAALINSWSDAQLVAAALAVLRRIFGRNVPEPTAVVRSGWQHDPYARGSYSFARIGQQPDDITRLAQPVGDRLFFAGEATHPTFYGTVHGAYESGIHAARRVLAATQA